MKTIDVKMLDGTTREAKVNAESVDMECLCGNMLPMPGILFPMNMPFPCPCGRSYEVIGSEKPEEIKEI